MSGETRVRGTALAAVLTAGLLAAASAGCDDDTNSAPGPAADTTATSRITDAATLTVRAVPLTARVDRVAGRLPRAQRRADVAHLTDTVRSWLDGGFVAEDYPSTDFSAAFRAFTPGAARSARRRPAIMTNAAVGADLVEVVPTRQDVRFHIFAPDGQAAGATAEVRLVLLGVRPDNSEVEIAVSGQLYLTRDQGWRVFGYDVQQHSRAPGSSGRGRR